MSDYTFRLRFRLSPRATIKIDASSISLPQLFTFRSTLSSSETEKTIHESKELSISGEGFSSKEEALKVGSHVRDALILTLGAIRIGAYFGEQGERGGFSESGFDWLRKTFGMSGRILNDKHGLVAFETDPPPRFARVGDITLRISHPQDRFFDLLSKASKSQEHLSRKHYLACELFSASFFEQSENARFLFLTTAIETLLDLRRRPQRQINHVENLILETRQSVELLEAERNSLIGNLEKLKSDSIGQAGKRLATEILAGRKYSEMPPDRFFSICYELRSRLVHGSQPYPREEVRKYVGTLEVFVSDLLAGPLLEPQV